MNAQEDVLRGYVVSVTAAEGTPDIYTVAYVPRGLQQKRGPSGRPKRVPEYRAHVRAKAKEPVTWQRPPAKGITLEELEEDARNRVNRLHTWIENLAGLFKSVKGWAEEIGWATKVIEKPIEDSAIGRYTIPALLLQRETTKVVVEPVARAAPGAEGVVDLYLMPGYDDIATLYYYGNKWNLHYMADQSYGASVREAEGRAISKVSLRKVLDEMTSHAA